ncbi:MAG: DUF4397 domain-containing protein [Woeseia sp.]|nr:DUF4397 domain-containing protein [Woeseia sp.]
MKFSSKFLVICSMLVLAACDSDNNIQPELFVAQSLAALKLQVLHGSPDAPAVNVLVNGGEELSNVDYKVGSA